MASYVVEGGPSRDYLHTKRLMYDEPEGWNRLMELLVDATARYLNGQIAAGAEAVQVFDSLGRRAGARRLPRRSCRRTRAR